MYRNRSMNYRSHDCFFVFLWCSHPPALSFVPSPFPSPHPPLPICPPPFASSSRSLPWRHAPPCNISTEDPSICIQHYSSMSLVLSSNINVIIIFQIQVNGLNKLHSFFFYRKRNSHLILVNLCLIMHPWTTFLCLSCFLTETLTC